MSRSKLLSMAVVLLSALSLGAASHALPRCEGRLLRSEIEQRQDTTLLILQAAEFDKLQQRLDGFLNAYTSAKLSDEELFHEFAAFSRWSSALTPHIKGWIERYPKSFAAHHAMALHITAEAWQMRGVKRANETTPQQMTEFMTRLRAAREWSLRSIQLHPKPILAYQHLMANATALRFDASLASSANRSGLSPTTKLQSIPRPDVLPILDESIRLQPDNTIVRTAYIWLLAPKWGGSLEALEEYTRPSTHAGLSPDRVATVTYEALLEIGGDYEFRKRLDDAVPVYELAAKVCRLNQPFVNIAHIRLKQHRYADVLNAAESTLALVPGSAAGLRLKALALHGLGRHDEAAPLLVKRGPGGAADEVYLLGEYYASGLGGLAKDPQQARRLFTLAARGGDERAAKRLQEMGPGS